VCDHGFIDILRPYRYRWMEWCDVLALLWSGKGIDERILTCWVLLCWSWVVGTWRFIISFSLISFIF
jgi:hypothetical protein